MKVIPLLCLLACLCIPVFSADIDFLWPIARSKTGDNIIMYPSDQIFIKERNESTPFGGIIIGAPEGTPVFAMEDGKVISSSFNINFSHYSAFGDDDYTTLCEIVDKKMDIDKKYIVYSLRIEIGPGQVINYDGLKAPGEKKFKTGETVKKGEVIGKVGHYFKGITQSCIAFSYEVGGKLGDIGLKLLGIKNIAYLSNIKRQPINYSNYNHPMDKLQEAYFIFRDSILEGHPGLYDYISQKKLKDIFDQIEVSIDKPMTSDYFYRFLMPAIRALSDNHTYLRRKYLSDKSLLYSPETYFPIRLSVIRSKCYIIDPGNLDEYQAGVEVLGINNEPMKTIINKLQSLCNVGDGFITGWGDGLLQKEISFLGSGFGPLYSLAYDVKGGTELFLKIKGPEEAESVRSVVLSSDPESTPRKKALLPFKALEIKYINKSTAYLKIRTMNLNEKQLEKISGIIKEINSKNIRSLIIDIRDNMGGDINVTNYIYSFLAEKPFQPEKYRKARKNTTYALFKNSSNYISAQLITENYKFDKIQDAFLLMPEDSNGEIHIWEPNKKNRFNGDLYVLTNEFTGSAAVSLAAYIHFYKRGQIIGREGASGYHRMNGLDFAKIPLGETGLELNLPLIQTVFADNKKTDIPAGRGVIPDFIIPITVEDVIQRRDVVLESAMEIISKKYNKKNYFTYGIIIALLIVLVVSIITKKIIKK